MGKKEKKHKHEKKHKKEKKQKKEKSSSTEKRNTYNHDDPLNNVLTGILLDCPKLLEELPAILTAFDNQELVHIKMISDQIMRDSLLLLMRYLPGIKEHSQGFYYDKSVTGNSLSKSILHYLLEEKIVVEPKQLSHAQQIASRSAPLQLLDLVAKYPDLKQELLTIFDQILDGSAIQIQDLPNEDLVERLERLFKNLQIPEHEDGFGLGKESKSGYEIVSMFQSIFQNYQNYQKLLHPRKSEKSSKKDDSKHSSKSRNENGRSDDDDNDNSSQDSEDSSTSSSSSSTASSSSSRRSLPDPAESAGKRTQGPAMPSKADLLFAAKMKYPQIEDNQMEEVEDDADDDDFGPKIITASTKLSNQSSAFLDRKIHQHQVQPLGFTGMEDIYQGDNKQTEEDNGTELLNNNLTEREEWLLTPGESRAFAILDGNLKNRKFQSGKQAKKLAEKYQIQKAYQRSLMEGGQEVIEQEEKEEEEDRRPTLMEEHLSKKAKKDHEDSASSAGMRRAFDREKDVLASKKLNTKEVQHLVENAKELNSKFDKAVVQRSFL